MKILLTTLHAKYVHASLALPCLAAACRDIDGVETVIREFTVNEQPERTLRAVVAEGAELVAFSCYIWNIGETLRLASDLKKVRPETLVVLGGPEASFGVFRLLERNPAVDCVIRGEGEATFREVVAALKQGGVCREALQSVSAGITFRSGDELIALPERPPIQDLDAIPSPFAAGLADLSKPLVYYESSRGCPFACAFCLSSLERGVRSFSPERMESDLATLLERGAKTVKFVDRTFNYDAARANNIWEFILRENRESRFHFEIAADLLTDENLALLRKVPEGVFRFEIGVQSVQEETLARVGRKSDLARLFANLERLRRETGVVVHLDLVAGLPGEDFGGFLASLQRLLEVNPHHIQVEPLKVLKGSPMRRIAVDEKYAFSDTPPYKILGNPWLSFDEIGRIETIARLLDLLYNSGKFAASLAVLAEETPLSRAFAEAARFWEAEGITHGLSQKALFEAFRRFGDTFLARDRRERFRDALCYDFCLAEYPGNRLPSFFQGNGGMEKVALGEVRNRFGIPAGSRVRTFACRLDRDYRRAPWREGATELLFVYISAPGQGFRVKVLEAGARREPER